MPSSTGSLRSQLNLQTFTLEYIVDGAFDGSTIAPKIVVDPTSPDYVPPDPVDGVYRKFLPPGQSLGLIDLSLGSLNIGGIGDRFVRSVLAGNSGAGIAFINGVLGVFDDLPRSLGITPDPMLMEAATLLNGEQGFYEPSCIFVPQGAMLGIRGLAAPVSGHNIIRVNVEVPQTIWDAALMAKSCCCDNGEPGPGPGPGDCPVILEITPSPIPEPPFGGPFTTITIIGSGFADGQAIQAELAPPNPPGIFASLTEFSIIDDNTATVVVEFPTSSGLYNLRIFDPADPEGCFGEAQLIVESPIFACPDVTDLIPDTFIAGGPAVQAQLTGTDLLSVSSIEIEDTLGNIVVTQLAGAFAVHTDLFIATANISIPLATPTGTSIFRVFSSNFLCPPIEISIQISN